MVACCVFTLSQGFSFIYTCSRKKQKGNETKPQKLPYLGSFWKGQPCFLQVFYTIQYTVYLSRYSLLYRYVIYVKFQVMCKYLHMYCVFSSNCFESKVGTHFLSSPGDEVSGFIKKYLISSDTWGSSRRFSIQRGGSAHHFYYLIDVYVYGVFHPNV